MQTLCNTREYSRTLENNLPRQLGHHVYATVGESPMNKGLLPIHYKYFVRNLTLHHFLLSPEAWDMPVSINLTSDTSSKLVESSRTLSCILPLQLRHHVYAFLPVRHLQAFMFHASGIILYLLQIVCYFNLKILFNK